MLQILQWLLSYKYCVKSESESVSCSVVADSLWPHGLKAPLSMDFSGQKSWSGWSFPFPGNLPDLGIEPRSPALQADSLSSEPSEKPNRVFRVCYIVIPKCLPDIFLSTPSRLCDNYRLPCQCSCSPRLPGGEPPPMLQVLLGPCLLQGVFPL